MDADKGSGCGVFCLHLPIGLSEPERIGVSVAVALGLLESLRQLEPQRFRQQDSVGQRQLEPLGIFVTLGIFVPKWIGFFVPVPVGFTVAFGIFVPVGIDLPIALTIFLLQSERIQEPKRFRVEFGFIVSVSKRLLESERIGVAFGIFVPVGIWITLNLAFSFGEQLRKVGQ